MAAWLGVLAPAGLPAAQTHHLNTEITKVLNSSAFKDRLGQLGAEETPGRPEEFSAFLRAELQKWGQAVRESNARVE